MKLLTAALIAVMFAGCVKDPFDESGKTGSGKTLNATFTLAPEFMEVITVRSVDGVNENVITDLWVVQLNPDGTAQLQAPKYITTGFTESSGDWKVSVPLKSQDCKIFFIANTHSDSAFTNADTEDMVKAVNIAVSAETKLASDKGIPMSGMWQGTPDLLGVTQRVSLSRAVSKVNFSINASLPVGERFQLHSVNVKKVPGILSYYRGVDAATPYPANPDTIEYSVSTFNKTELGVTPQSLWWYLPENARGTGSATIQTEKAKSDKFPPNQAAYCTYIEVRGEYFYRTGLGVAATYRIYLGANNTNDYNLLRNTLYNVKTTIMGVDSVDTRIDFVELAPLDYTDNGQAWLLIAPADAKRPIDGSSSLNWYLANGIYDATYNPGYLSSCPAGWRVPHKSDFILAWIYSPAFTNSNLSSAYWSQTDYINDRVWITSLDVGTTTSLEKYSTAKLRCVKDIPLTVNKYPYVGIDDSGVLNVIVSRDSNGGVISTALHQNWSQPAIEHTERDNTVNLVSAKLEVAKNDCNTTNSPGVAATTTTFYTWANAALACAAYKEGILPVGSWRLPTQRELKLIGVMQKELTSITPPVSNNKYWSATTFSKIPEDAFIVHIMTGDTHNMVKTAERPVRCVRDVTTVISRPNIIDNIQYAVGNLVADGSNGCKIGAPTDGGLYFQCGSLVGWSGGAIGDGTGQGKDLVTPALAVKVQPADCNYSYTSDADWTNMAKIWQGTTGTLPQPNPGTIGTKGIGDPCLYYLGSNWRLPTQAECNALFGQIPAFSGSFTWGDTVPGWVKSGAFTATDYGYAKHTKTGMQIPASGHRTSSIGALNYIGTYGYFASSSPYDDSFVYCFRFNETEIFPSYKSFRSNGFPVRCVRNIN